MSLPLPLVVLVFQPPLYGTHSHLAFATLPLPIPSVALKLAASSRTSAPPSDSPKCLRFGHWLTLFTLNIVNVFCSCLSIYCKKACFIIVIRRHCWMGFRLLRPHFSYSVVSLRVVCLSVCHIRAPCLNRSTDLDPIWQAHLWTVFESTYFTFFWISKKHDFLRFFRNDLSK